jgi:hypothetical protein
MTTTNLNLFTYNLKSNGDIAFDDLRSFINGSGSSSNMVKIDNWSFQQPIILSSILSSFSGSETLISGSLNSIDDVLADSGSQISEFDSRFEVIGTFSGSGQPDFSSISQDYTHLLIIGTAATENPNFISNVGIDFNGDVSTVNYNESQWSRSGSSYPYGSDTITTGSRCLLIGNVSGCVSGCDIHLYGGSVYALIPNYSGSTSFYKTTMGFSSLSQDTWIDSSLSSGVWKATNPIDRIRIFGIDSVGNKYNFMNGTEFTLYGVE